METAIDPPAGPCQTPSERRNHRRYVIELGAAMAAYIVLLNASLAWLGRIDGTARYAVALLPVIGVAAITLAIVRYAMRLDEFQRRNIYYATATAAAVTTVVTMILGFLENAGIPRVSMIWVFPIATFSFGAALPFFQFRAR